MPDSDRSRSCGLVALLIVAALASSCSEAATAAQRARLETGSFLVARPSMADPHFAHTVVLLLSYGDDGALGVIVNRPTPALLIDLLPQVQELTETQHTVYWGGPVGPENLVFLLRTDEPPEDCAPVLEDVCTGGVLDLVERGLDAEDPASAFKTCIGYAGWAPGQLEWEIERDGWYVMPATSRRVFSNRPEKLWEELVRQAQLPLA